MAVITPIPKTQFLDAAGAPLAGGFVYTYQAGTTTPQATYTDSTGATPNSNPIVLDSRGEANIWLGEATYKMTLCNPQNTEIWTVDYISAPTTAVSPVLSGNVTISTDSSGPALKITQTGTGDVLRVQDSPDPDSTPFVINASGYVGIGTVAPAEALDIDNNGKIQFSSSGTARTVISADATNSTFDVKDDRNFVVKANASTVLTANSTSVTTTVPVVLPGVPTTSLQSATKGYVDTTAATTVTTSSPPGAIMAFAASTAPTGWLACDGSAVSRTTYAALFSAISTIWGTGDGSTTFNVPDLRGQFLRGYDSRTPGSGALDTTIFCGTTTSGSPTIGNLTTAITSQLAVGMPITGTGIPAGAKILTVSSTSITMDANATANTATVTGTTTSTTVLTSSAITSMSSTSGLFVGQVISGTNIASGTYIVSIDSASQVTISQPVTGNGSVTITTYTKLTAGRAFAGYQPDKVGSHYHNSVGVPASAGSGAAAALGQGTTGGGQLTSSINDIATGETRPKNYAVLYIIKT